MMVYLRWVNICMVRIRFNTNQHNMLTTMMLREAVRIKLRRDGVQYTEVSKLPYELEMTDAQFTLFCLLWDAPYDWTVREQS